jgi:peptidoglycan/LPS O-acetylase OafA/YrhL
LLLEAWKQTHSGLQGSTLGVSLPWIDKIGSGFLLCYVANPKHAIARLLCAPSLRWCGIISYEWYLFHQPIIQWARQIFGPAGGNRLFYVEIVGGSLLLSGVLSALIYRYFSLPILKYGRAGK